MESSAESGSRSAVVTRRFPRHPREVWERLTSNEGFEDWMGAGSTIEAQPGGRLIAADPESNQPKIGRVLEVAPGRSLRWVWRPLGEETTTEVLVTIEPDTAKSGSDEFFTPPEDHCPGDDAPSHTLITVTERPSTVGVPSACAGGMTSSRTRSRTWQLQGS